VLMALARLGGYGFVYVSETGASTGATSSGSSSVDRPISISFRGESYSRAINSSLLAAGLQGKLEGGLILAGPKVLSKSFGPQMSKVYRLNQASANSAADYLANLGASVNKTNTITTAVTRGVDQNQSISTAPSAATTESTTVTSVESYGASSGPLAGLIATTDTRLSTITLVGAPALVSIGEQYLKQLDLRQRQVALSVKILDVTLDNDQAVENSFAFRYGNNFIVNDLGQLVGSFGSLLPPRGDQFDTISGNAATAKPVQETIEGNLVTRFPLSPAPVNPGTAYDRDNFYDRVRALIEARTTKVLASPTLILSENPSLLREGKDASAIEQQLPSGSNSSSSSSSNSDDGATIGRTRANESYVTVGEQVITNYTVQAGQNGAPNTCQPEFGISGLTFGARVTRIDDNGFVTFSMTPAITAVTRTTDVPNCGPIDVLAIRRLDTGSARVRDGQTLIMTGVISDLDSQVVRKWPIFGDLPLVGQFFRDTSGSRRKRELVIMVTPRIVNDVEGGTYGYGWQPSTPQSRDLMRGVR